MAEPLPGGGQYAFVGQPTIAAGFWRSLDTNTSQLLVNSVDGYISEYLAGLDNPVEQTLARALSFQCIDSKTWLGIYNVSSYVQATPPTTVSLQICSIRRIEGDILRYAYTLTSTGSCPEIGQLPTTNATTTENNTVKGSFIRVFSSNVTLPSPYECVNATSTNTTWTAPLPSDPPAPPTGTPCANPPLTPIKPGQPAATDVVQGLWLQQTQISSVLEARIGWGTANWNLDPSLISGTVGQYLASECLDASSANVESFYQRRFLNGSTSTGWSCRVKVRQEIPGGVTLTVKANATATEGDLQFLIAPLAGNPSTTCPIAPPPPPPQNTCTYRGIWRISPLYHPCEKLYFTFEDKDCKNNTVSLRTMAQIASDPNKATWGLNYDYVAGDQVGNPQNVVAIRTCNATTLAGPDPKLDGAPTVALKDGDYPVKLIPVSSNCLTINIVAANGPDGNNYLTVPNTCGTFAWAAGPSGRSRFKLSKVSEVLLPPGA